MPYITQSDLEGIIPAKFIVSALDADNDGVADAGVWDKMLSAVQAKIDGTLGQRFSVPFSAPVPPIVKAAALTYAAAAIYRLKGYNAEQNPFTKDEATMASKLDAMAKSEEPLSPDVQRKRPPVSVIVERAKTYPANGEIFSA